MAKMTEMIENFSEEITFLITKIFEIESGICRFYFFNDSLWHQPQMLNFSLTGTSSSLPHDKYPIALKVKMEKLNLVPRAILKK